MESGLKGKRVAILATNGVEASELAGPREALDAAGAVTEIVSPEGAEITTVSDREVARPVHVDHPLADVRAADYVALVLPGGEENARGLRGDQRAVQFVREMMVGEKPVAAICDGARLLIEADAVGGRTVASSASLGAEVEAAGGHWVDEAVHVDEHLVTSRRRDDVPAFSARLVQEFGDRLDDRRVDQLSEQSFPASDPPSMP